MSRHSVCDLFRGEHYGVFEGANGYYVARMADDGFSHYQHSGQHGWSDKALARCNDEAEELEEEEEAI